jgi:hypothetical protein
MKGLAMNDKKKIIIIIMACLLMMIGLINLAVKVTNDNYERLSMFSVVVHFHNGSKDYYIAKGIPGVNKQSVFFCDEKGNEHMLSGDISITSYKTIDEAREVMRAYLSNDQNGDSINLGNGRR